jgi:predicted alpha-1,2-mannosidase
MPPSPAVRPSLFVGTDSTHELSAGNTLPLWGAPHGLTHWTLESRPDRYVYRWRDRKLTGIRATHQPSPWMGDYGWFTLLPFPYGLDPARLDDGVYFDREGVAAGGPERMDLRLPGWGIHVTLAATAAAAVIEVRSSGEEMKLGLRLPEGSLRREPGGAAGEWRVKAPAQSGGLAAGMAAHYALRFEPAPARVESGPEGWHVLVWPRGQARRWRLTVGSSFLDAAQARVTREREIGRRSLAAVARQSAARWARELGVVQAEGLSTDQQASLTSTLYRCALNPRQWVEYDAAGRAVHANPHTGKRAPGARWVDVGFWDVYRTLFPLLTWLCPARVGDMVAGFTRAAEADGWMAQWPSPGFRACMVGTHGDVVVADAIIKGLPGFDPAAAYAAVRRHAFEPVPVDAPYGRPGLAEYLARGYIPDEVTPHATAMTCDYALDDFALAAAARVLGETDDATALAARAGNYRHVFDRRTRFFRARLRDGSWKGPFDPYAWGREYIEGSAWQHRWSVPHDPAGLIALMGGPRRFVAELDRMLSAPPEFRPGGYPTEIHEMIEMATAGWGQYAHSNQPVHHVLPLYAAAGRWDRAEQTMHRVLRELYRATPDGLAGDEDNGEMSAWYILGVLGLFPLRPATGEWLALQPLATEARVRIEGGPEVEIVRRGPAAPAGVVREVKWNGRQLPERVVSHAALAHGGRLEFVL